MSIPNVVRFFQPIHSCSRPPVGGSLLTVLANPSAADTELDMSSGLAASEKPLMEFA